jgi:hypothetical protein
VAGWLCWLLVVAACCPPLQPASTSNQHDHPATSTSSQHQLPKTAPSLYPDAEDSSLRSE